MADRKWFNENMSSDEAAAKLFSLPKEELEKNKKEIMEEYKAVTKIIIHRELELVEQGWLF